MPPPPGVRSQTVLLLEGVIEVRNVAESDAVRDLGDALVCRGDQLRRLLEPQCLEKRAHRHSRLRFEQGLKSRHAESGDRRESADPEVAVILRAKNRRDQGNAWVWHDVG